MHVFHQAAVLALTVQAGFMFEPVLKGASHDGLAVDDAVGLGNDAAVDGAWLVIARGAMVFGRIGNGVDFILIEPLLQPLIFTHNAGAVDVM